MKTVHKYFVGTISGFALTAAATGYLFRRNPASTPNPTQNNAQQGVKPMMTVTHSFKVRLFSYLVVTSHIIFPVVQKELSDEQPPQTLFAVPLSCDGCVKDVSNALYKVSGISKVEGNLEDQLLSIEGTGNFPPFYVNSFPSSFHFAFLIFPAFYSLAEMERGPSESLIIDLGFKNSAAPPSAIVKAIQATGRDAILRGSGTSNSKCDSVLYGASPP